MQKRSVTGHKEGSEAAEPMDEELEWGVGIFSLKIQRSPYFVRTLDEKSKRA